MDIIEKQRQLEADMLNSGSRKYRKAILKHQQKCRENLTDYGRSLIGSGIDSLNKAILDFMEKKKGDKGGVWAYSALKPIIKETKINYNILQT